MDGSRFDDLTRALAAGSDRRRFVRGLAAGLGGTLGLAALRRGEANPGGGGGKPQGRCPSGYTNCRGTCVDLTDNPNHCGACNTVCSPGKVCVGGACACPSTACPEGQELDATSCTCRCVERTCCGCVDQGGFSLGCSTDAYRTAAECAAACAAEGGTAVFAAGPGLAYRCLDGGFCDQTCGPTA